MHPPGVTAADLLHPARRLLLRHRRLPGQDQRNPHFIDGRQLEFTAHPHRCGIFQFLGDLRHLRLAVENAQPLKQLLIRNATLRHRRHFQQEMEVVGHQAIRQHPATRELLAHAHQHPEMLPFIHLQHELPPHDPAEAVVDHRFRPRILPRHRPSLAVVHDGGRLERGKTPARQIYVIKLDFLKRLDKGPTNESKTSEDGRVRMPGPGSLAAAPMKGEKSLLIQGLQANHRHAAFGACASSTFFPCCSCSTPVSRKSQNPPPKQPPRRRKPPRRR